MCITFFSTGIQNKNCKFILVFSREEFFNRESNALGFYSDENLFYPLDCPTKGSFLCVNVKNGNICVLLNNNFSNNEYIAIKPRKRGDIPLDFCRLSENKLEHLKFINDLENNKNEYNGYSIVFGNIKSGHLLYYTNNTEQNTENISLPYEINNNEIYGLSNDFLNNQNELMRIKYGKDAIKEIINKSDEVNIEDIFNLMNDTTKFLEKDSALTNDLNVINNKNLKKYISSSIFVEDKLDNLAIQYGTRYTVFITLDLQDVLTFYEYFDEIIPNSNILTINKRNFNNLQVYKFNL